MAAAISCAGPAFAQAEAIDIAPQPLTTALYQLGVQTGQQIIFSPSLASAKMSQGARSADNVELALSQVLEGTGLAYERTSDAILIKKAAADPQSGSAAGDGADGTVEALIVTAQKREEDIQDVPIAISAFTQEDLTRSQVAGGPDLMTQVPNFTFTKTNFSSYSIQIRGIGTQAISATVDPAVAVAFNNTPFVRNRFFEQEFYDLQRVEVLRGPQGTLYGRNATAGVVNIISAKPSFRHEAKLSGDIANYNSRRLEGMINIPLVEDIAALRIAGAWTKRDGYTTNELTGNPIDGRDLWSTRVSLRIEPTDTIRANLIWEHFEEDDDRLRSGKQLCKKHVPTEIGGLPVVQDDGHAGSIAATFSQGCEPTSLYSPDAFQTPHGFSLPYYGPLNQIGLGVFFDVDPYVSVSQSRDLRVIESTRDPEYRAQTNTGQLQLELDVSPTLTVTSETAYSADELFSTQDFNRFNTKPGAFHPTSPRGGLVDGVFCDPQVGCSDRLVLVDLSTARSSHFSQELRLSSDYDGPFNFSAGANFLRYDTEDKYYVFINTLTMWAERNGPPTPYVVGVSDNSEFFKTLGRRRGDPTKVAAFRGSPIYIDPNPIGSLNDQGHNYFLSKNPYRLISYAVFGETYYRVTDALKITTGLRWTVDKKHAPRIPSWLLAAGTYGYPVLEVVKQEWREPTGRLTIDWKPDLGITDESLLYASYAHGYKAGGMNPPPPVLALQGDGGDQEIQESLVQPKTFDAEFVDAFEGGIKNTLLDGRATINLGAFYYDYEGYQLSQIVNRSAVTQNFDAEVWGLEIEADWRPLENLRLGFKVGYENTRVGDGMQAIDLMDRTAGNPDWVVVRPFPAVPSNCILPVWQVTYGGITVPWGTHGGVGPCVNAYVYHRDPITNLPYIPNPEYDASDRLLSALGYGGYPGFDPSTAPNNGEGIFKDLSGNELPNAPHYTATLTADYTIPLPSDWLMTLHTDLYYQSEAWTRIFNMEGYDKLKAYSNINLAAIFTNEEAGWNVMAYVKNVFDRDSITGAFLNSDDTGLTTNVFLTEPRLFGLRVTKSWTGEPIFGGLIDASSKGPFPLTVEIGGQVQRHEAPNEVFRPDFVNELTTLEYPLSAQDEDLDWGDGREVKVTWRPRAGQWKVSAGARYGRTNGSSVGYQFVELPHGCIFPTAICEAVDAGWVDHPGHYGSTEVTDREDHTIVDFTIGRDFGLGSGIASTLAIGLRHAKLNSTTNAELWGTSEVDLTGGNLKYDPQRFDRNTVELTTDRNFSGGGPTLSWDGQFRLLGDESQGEASLDWGLTGGVMFGRQSADIRYEGEIWRSQILSLGHELETIPFSGGRSESKSATVPIFGASLGLSYEIQRLKLGAGYRWERYFDAIDGGVDERREVDRTIDGPYFKLSVGFGG